jgi:hypothetical protein
MPLLRSHRLTLALLLSAGVAVSIPAAAQTPTNTPAEPAATPVPASSLPSEPAATPAPAPASAPAPTTAPASSMPSVPAATPAPAYRDPLEQPIGTNQQPAAQTPKPVPAASVPSLPAYDLDNLDQQGSDHLGSTYIPVDSPIYPMAMRLYSMGYLDKAVISMRPWTRRSLLHMLAASSDDIQSEGNDEAIAILARLQDYLIDEELDPSQQRGTVYGLESIYTRFMGIGGTPLRDSFHLGQTISNDYGRPYAQGFNNITGFSSVNEHGRFSLYVRGEYQHSPSAPGYSFALANQLSCADGICPFGPPNDPQATLPYGNTGAQNPFRIQEATLSFHLLGHEISAGKSDAWLGPAQGGAMAWSDNAENIYSFRINRVEPLNIPLLSYLFGTVRYDFFVGSLKGHTAPNDPWIHSEMFAFRPTDNFEFGFQRSVIWGGKDHGPITLHSFLKSFFSITDSESNPGEKSAYGQDPGARFSDFNFSWRLPFMHHYVTLYTDSIAHDDVTPISAPRRAAYRPGVYISQFPGLPKLDFRIEAASTDTSTLRSEGGYFNYYEGFQPQGDTNKGFIVGDWVGREAKAGQVWLTWHLSPDEFIQVEYMHKKTPKDFIPGGTTQNQMKVELIKRLPHQIQLDAWLQFERWKAPVDQALLDYQPITITGGPLYHANAQNDTVIAAQFTWFPKLHSTPGLNGK